jgi:hypothetical protein
MDTRPERYCMNHHVVPSGVTALNFPCQSLGGPTMCRCWMFTHAVSIAATGEDSGSAVRTQAATHHAGDRSATAIPLPAPLASACYLLFLAHLTCSWSLAQRHFIQLEARPTVTERCADDRLRRSLLTTSLRPNLRHPLARRFRLGCFFRVPPLAVTPRLCLAP